MLVRDVTLASDLILARYYQIYMSVDMRGRYISGVEAHLERYCICIGFQYCRTRDITIKPEIDVQ